MARKDEEIDDQSFESMPHLADGGVLDDFSVNTGDSDTLKGLPLPESATGADLTGSGPKPAVVTQPTALTSKASNPTALPGMPADVTPDELERYLGRQKDSFSKFGADPQYAMQQEMLDKRMSPGASAANAGAGFADALMMGVARAGNPGFQKNQQDRVQGVYNDKTASMKGAHDTALQDVHASLDLDSKNPQSPLSRSSQKAYASTLISAGIPKDQVSNMSAELISDIAGKRITLADAIERLKLEHTYRMGELGLQAATLNQTKANQQATRKADAAKALEGRGVWRRTTDAITGNPATKALESELAPGTTFETEAEAEAANIPDGTKVTIGGKTGTWKHR